MQMWATLLLVITMAGSTMAEKGEFAWRDFGAAMAEAKETNKMIFVDIYTDW